MTAGLGIARAALVVANALTFAAAAWLWPSLPDRVPMHYGLDGAPNGWADKTVWSWFLLPTLGLVLAAVFGWLLPSWLRTLARSNSPALNLPDRERFRALPEAARVRVVDATLPALCWIGVATTGLIGWSVWSSGQVATGAWSGMPFGPTLAGVLAIVACALVAAAQGKRAVRRAGG